MLLHLTSSLRNNCIASAIDETEAYIDKLESSSLVRASNPSQTTAYLSVGESAVLPHYSTSLKDHCAKIKVNYEDSYGYPRHDDFSCESKSYWYGNPTNAYKITNKGSAAVYGVAVTLSFNGASISGGSSASDSVYI